MRHIGSGLAAAAVAGLITTAPAGAQTTVPAEVLDIPTQVPVAVANRLPSAGERVVINSVPRTRLTENRYYDAARETYAVFDPDASVWLIHDAETDAVVDTVAVGQRASPQVGMATNEIGPGLEPAAVPMPNPAPRAGVAEERYYDADRESYAVHLPVKSVWQIYDAESGRPMEVLSDGEFDPYEPGYTVVVPGETRIGAGMTRGPLPDRDVVEVIETD